MKYYPTFRWAILQKEVSPYVLLSRPPLPFHLAAEKTSDLHISGTPPTFILSQDQTLKKVCCPPPAGGGLLTRLIRLKK